MSKLKLTPEQMNRLFEIAIGRTFTLPDGELLPEIDQTLYDAKLVCFPLNCDFLEITPQGAVYLYDEWQAMRKQANA